VFYGIPGISAMDGLCLRTDTEYEAVGGGRNLNRTNKIVLICLIITKTNVITLQCCAKYYIVRLWKNIFLFVLHGCLRHSLKCEHYSATLLLCRCRKMNFRYYWK